MSSARIREDDAILEDLTTIEHIFKRSGARLRDAQSAELVCIGIWRNSRRNDCTAETLLATKVFYREGDWLSQANIMVDSVQQWYSRFRSWSAERAKCIKRARNNAADNSNRGTLMVLRGATFDLAARKKMVIESSILMILRYTAIVKAAVDASENPWRAQCRVMRSVNSPARNANGIKTHERSLMVIDLAIKKLARNFIIPSALEEPQSLHENFSGNANGSSPC